MPDAWDRECDPVRVAIEIDRDPGSVLRALRADRMPFGLIGQWAGGGAIVGSEPVAVLRGGAVLDPPELRCAAAPDGVVGGGWVGYFGYSLGQEIERLPPPPPRPRPLGLGQLALYDHVLHLDAAGCWWIEALWPDALERAADRLRPLLAVPVTSRPWQLEPLRPAGAGAAGHRAAVAGCVERIAAGELFQANLCLRLEARFDGSPLDAFVSAAAQLEPAHGAFLTLADGALLSFSPELFLRRRGRTVESAPIKGTLPRAEDPELAGRARSRLRASGKDAAEHVMIVDLMRNDLGRVARYGSVVADPEPRVEAHPGLWHLVTTVAGELRSEVGDGRLLRATFPPGSVTGAPKVQALKVISELEGTAREAYTGAIGIISPASGLELNVAIRTLEIRGGDAWIGCGGGVVADSDPERELREAFDKAAPIAAALGSSIDERGAAADGGGRRPVAPPLPRLSRRPDPRVGLYETLRVRDGVPVELDAHLRRLADGVGTEYGISLPDDLRARLLDAAAGTRLPAARLRVDISPDAGAAIALTPVGAPPAPVRLTPVSVTGGLGARKLADRAPMLEFEHSAGAALICDLDGIVLEASSANVWALVGDELLTPPADGRILPGITRAAMLALGEVAGLAVRVATLTLADLRRADGVVVTSSVRIAAPAALWSDTPSAGAERVAQSIRTALEREGGGYPPGGGAGKPAPPATDWIRPAQTALAPRSPTLKTM